MKRSLTIILFYLSLIIFWQMAFDWDLLGSYFASPVTVCKRLKELFNDGSLVAGIKATFARMMIGFSLSVTLGLIFGMAMGLNTYINQCFKSLFLGLQTLPTVAWAPFAVMVFGLQETGIYFVIIMSSMAAVATSTADGIAHIPPLYLRAAQTLGTPRWAMGWRVILPAALPSIMAGIKLGWTMAWHGVVSAELIGISSVGLGWLLHMGRENSDMPQLIAMMLVTILFGVLLDRFLFGVIQHRIRLRWGLAKET